MKNVIFGYTLTILVVFGFKYCDDGVELVGMYFQKYNYGKWKYKYKNWKKSVEFS